MTHRENGYVCGIMAELEVCNRWQASSLGLLCLLPSFVLWLTKRSSLSYLQVSAARFRCPGGVRAPQVSFKRYAAGLQLWCWIPHLLGSTPLAASLPPVVCAFFLSAHNVLLALLWGSERSKKRKLHLLILASVGLPGKGFGGGEILN